VEIRKATFDDLEQVRRWLRQEKDDGHDSFIVNFDLIEAGQETGSLIVLVDEIPIAFALADDMLWILAVKRDRRRSGVGRRLADHWFQQARERDLIGFHGECSPRESIGFWKKMGCQQVESAHGGGDAPWVAMPFRKKRELPVGMRTVPVCFEISSPGGAPAPQWNFATQAAVIEPDDLMLAEDFVAYVPEADTRVVISVDNSEIGAVKVRDIEEFGGTRKCPWIRVRDLALK
jgi:GNAT superfamily N-acetyltransferase